MVTLKFVPQDEDCRDGSEFSVTADTFPQAVVKFLAELVSLFFSDDQSDEEFAEVFEVLVELAADDDCEANREDFSTPESNYTIVRSKS